VLLAFGLIAALYSPAAHADPISIKLSIDVFAAPDIAPFIDFL